MTKFKSMKKPKFLADSLQNYRQYLVLILLAMTIFSVVEPSKAAEKMKNNGTSSAKSDTKKFDELKLTDASIWRCENNVIVKTAESTQGYLLLWNNKLYVMNKIDALRGVQRYTNDTFHLNWIEIPDKAMLFNFKIGQRVLDYCKTPELVANAPRMNQEDLMK